MQRNFAAKYSDEYISVEHILLAALMQMIQKFKGSLRQLVK